ncbi:ABC transporter permease [Microbacterium sp.]|uniref:ABC transporter permease n=1 Tax=Microbacterium sp. TaxID=51671 RepID=UPI0039E55D12
MSETLTPLSPTPMGSAPVTHAPRAMLQRWIGVLPPAGWAVLAIVLACVFGPALLPFPATELNAGAPFEGPSATHWFGTDDLGRDMLARTLTGGQLSLTIGVGATAISVLLGMLWGMTAAAYGGWVDTVLMRLGDAAMAIPQILFALVCVAAFRPTAASMTIVIGLLLSPTTARLVRSASVSELAGDYVVAARAVGQTRGRIMLTEIAPNVTPVVMVQAAINMVEAIMLEATLSFVGLGIQPPDASWGTLLLQGYSKMYNSAWLMVFPALMMIVSLVSLTFLSEQIGRRLEKTGTPA